MVSIRATSESDEPAIRALHEAAFGAREGPEIADLAIALLHDPTATPRLSLLVDGSTPAGHVLFTGARIEGCAHAVRASILAPHPIPEEHDDAWMVLELRSGTIARVRGTIRCADVLEAPRHWRE